MGDVYEIRRKGPPELIKKFTRKITRSPASSTIGTVLAEAIKNNGRSFNGCKKNEKEREKKDILRGHENRPLGCYLTEKDFTVSPH